MKLECGCGWLGDQSELRRGRDSDGHRAYACPRCGEGGMSTLELDAWKRMTSKESDDETDA